MAARFRVPPPPRLPPAAAVAAGGLLALAAFGLVSGFRHVFEHAAFAPFFLAVGLAAWVGGIGVGLACAALSDVLGWLSLRMAEGPDEARLGALAFLPFAFVIAAIGAAARAGFREREATAETLRASEARERARAEELEALMTAVPALVLVARDPEGRDVVASRFAQELLRLEPGASASQSAARPPTHFRLRRGGRELAAHELPTQAAARGEPSSDVELEVVFDDGTSRRILGNARTLFDDAGRPRGAIGAFVDVTTLANAIRARDEFLSIASHELKTPLTALRLHVDALSRRRDVPPELSAKTEAIQRQVSRLAALVNTLLDVSRVGESRLRLSLEQVDLAALAHDVAGRFAAEAANAGSELRVDAAGAVLGRWDRLRLEQVATNLLSNAIKYGDGNPVRVEVQADGDVARLVVADGGIGIAPEERRRIFERFERGGAAHGYGGLGLGLWIARELVLALGGSIDVESEVGRGSSFRVELPLDGPPAAAAPSPRGSAAAR